MIPINFKLRFHFNSPFPFQFFHALADVAALHVGRLEHAAVARQEVEVEAHDLAGLVLGQAAGFAFDGLQARAHLVGTEAGVEARHLVGKAARAVQTEGVRLAFGREADVRKELRQP